MKRICIVLALALIVAASGYARPFQFGFKGGTVLADQKFSYTTATGVDFDGRTGVQFGAFMEFPVGQYVSISPQVHYLPRGIKATYWVTTYDYPDGLYIAEAKPRVDYLSIPVLVKFTYPGQQLSPYVMVGPRIDIQVNSAPDMFNMVYDDFDKTLYGLTFGGGLDIRANESVSVFVEAAYHLDLTDVYETELLTVENKAFSILAGVKIW